MDIFANELGLFQPSFIIVGLLCFFAFFCPLFFVSSLFIWECECKFVLISSRINIIDQFRSKFYLNGFWIIHKQKHDAKPRHKSTKKYSLNNNKERARGKNLTNFVRGFIFSCYCLYIYTQRVLFSSFELDKNNNNGKRTKKETPNVQKRRK